jgi:hypothetical protein
MENVKLFIKQKMQTADSAEIRISFQSEGSDAVKLINSISVTALRYLC